MRICSSGKDHKAKDLMEEVGAIKKVFSPRLTTDTASGGAGGLRRPQRTLRRGAGGICSGRRTSFVATPASFRARDFAAAQTEHP